MCDHTCDCYFTATFPSLSPTQSLSCLPMYCMCFCQIIQAIFPKICSKPFLLDSRKKNCLPFPVLSQHVAQEKINWLCCGWCLTNKQPFFRTNARWIVWRMNRVRYMWVRLFTIYCLRKYALKDLDCSEEHQQSIERIRDRPLWQFVLFMLRYTNSRWAKALWRTYFYSVVLYWRSLRIYVIKGFCELFYFKFR